MKVIDLASLENNSKSKGALKEIAESIIRSKKVVALIGAGCSTSAGIPVSRVYSSLYRHPDIELRTGLSICRRTLYTQEKRQIYH